MTYVVMYKNAFALSFSKDLPITIRADKITYVKMDDIYIAEGNVEISQQSIVLKADQVIMDHKNNHAKASGDVVYNDGENLLTGEMFEFDIETQLGTIFQGDMIVKEVSYTYYITGDFIEKVGEDEFLVKNGTITTCNCKEGEASWKLAGNDIKITLGEYTYVKQAFFITKGTSIIFLPVVVFPIKTERETGFLTPNMGFSDRQGTELNVPFFWAIGPSVDATITLNSLSLWGLGFDILPRYMFSEKSYGEMNFEYFDQSERDFEADYNHPTEDQVKAAEALKEAQDMDRWKADLKHWHEFKDGSVGKANLHLLSDDQYLQDFKDNSAERLKVFQESRLSHDKTWDNFGLTSELKFYDDLAQIDDHLTLHKIPTVNFETIRFSILSSPLFFNFESSFDNFTRDTEPFEDFGIDQKQSTKDVGEDNESFDEGELVKEGRRLNLRPKLSLLLSPGAYFNIIPEIGFKETIYGIDAGDERVVTREIIDSRVNFGTNIARAYKLNGKYLKGIRHSIEPSAYYLYAPDIAQDNLPSFDNMDRISEKSIVVYSLTNKLIGKYVYSKDSLSYSDLVKLKLAQNYDFLAEEDPFSDVQISLSLQPISYLSISSLSNIRYDKKSFRYTESSLSLTDKRSDSLSISYIFSEEFTVDNKTRVTVSEALDKVYTRSELKKVSGSGTLKIYNFLSLTYSQTYSMLEGREESSGLTAIYTSRCNCWSLTTSYSKTTTPEAFTISLLLNMYGIGQIGIGKGAYLKEGYEQPPATFTY